MGKNNAKNKKRSYNYEAEYDHKGGYNDDKTERRPYNKKFDTTPKAPVEIPPVPQSIKDLIAKYDDQLRDFIEVHEHPEGFEPKAGIAIERDLFTANWGYADEDGRVFYTVEHTVRTDRQTKDFQRASSTVIVLDNTGVPVYSVVTYMNKDYTGAVLVYRMGKNGPMRRFDARVNITSGVVGTIEE